MHRLWGCTVGVMLLAADGTVNASDRQGSDAVDRHVASASRDVCRQGTSDWTPPVDPVPPPRPPLVPSARAGKLVATWHNARIFRDPDSKSTVIGYARRGQRLGVVRSASGSGCPADMWYKLEGGGYACASGGFRKVGATDVDEMSFREGPLPYLYAKVVREGAPMFERLPSGAELRQAEQALERGRGFAEPVLESMTGAYFVALVETIEHQGQRFHRTVKDAFVRDEDVEILEFPQRRGELVRNAATLPLAFVYTDEAEARCRCKGRFVPCGDVPKFARFHLREDQRKTLSGETYVATREGPWIPASQIRVARLQRPPSSVDGSGKWIHIDRREQVLVAYEGKRPVYATLVSTGTEGHATPLGTYEVDRRYVGTTMTGPDEDKGTYRVAEVPWTLFYDGAFAIHGAYWHDGFGEVRSHGCTNVPPADARWLFAWSGAVPVGWFASSHTSGPVVVVRDGSVSSAAD